MSQSIASRIPLGTKAKIDARPPEYYADSNFGPIIAEAICTDNSGQCSLGKVGNFTVNGQTSGTITESRRTNLLANISFYAMAYKQHMPIRSIKIDWDDGSVQSNVGYYKNNWPQCDPAVTINASPPDYTWGANATLDFAGTTQACQEGIRNYFHLYNYDSKFFGRYGCAATEACFKPRITVQDNWGWCTNNTWGPVGTNCPATTAPFTSAEVIYGGGGPNDLIKIKAPTN